MSGFLDLWVLLSCAIEKIEKMGFSGFSSSNVRDEEGRRRG